MYSLTLFYFKFCHAVSGQSVDSVFPPCEWLRDSYNLRHFLTGLNGFRVQKEKPGRQFFTPTCASVITKPSGALPAIRGQCLEMSDCFPVQNIIKKHISGSVADISYVYEPNIETHRVSVASLKDHFSQNKHFRARIFVWIYNVLTSIMKLWCTQWLIWKILHILQIFPDGSNHPNCHLA